MKSLPASNCLADGRVIVAPLIPDMDAFDSLPRALRDHLNSATIKYSALQVQDLTARYGAGAALHALTICENARIAA